MFLSDVQNWVQSKVIDWVPAVGAVATAIGAGWAVEGNFDEGADAALAGMAATLGFGILSDCNNFSEEFARNNIDVVSDSTRKTTNSRMRVSALCATAGVAVHGLANTFSGIRNLDLRQTGKGVFQYALGNMGAYMITRLPATAVSTICTTVMSAHFFCKGIKKIVQREWTQGAVCMAMGGLTAAISASLAAENN